MRHRLYTAPQTLPNESTLINGLLELGLPWLHLRKPQYSLAELESLIQAIEPAHHPRLVLHQHWELAERYAVGGLHWTEWHRRHYEPVVFERMVAQQQEHGWQVGTAVHHPLTLDQLPPYLDYATASPLFPSISKPGYRPSFDWRLGRSYPFKVIGLGGINATNVSRAKARGFQEVIFLGAVWGTPTKALQNYQQLCRVLQQLDPMS